MPRVFSLPSILLLVMGLSRRHYINRLPGCLDPLGCSQWEPLVGGLGASERAGKKAECLFPWFPLCEVTPGWLCTFREDHGFSERGLLHRTLSFQVQITDPSCFVSPGDIITLLLPALAFHATVVVPLFPTLSFIFGPFVDKSFSNYPNLNIPPDF